MVVAIEQAVAAPLCTARLADGGARVIKVERPEGDFARHYDSAAGGDSAYFVWLNRGKESVCLDLTKAPDRALLEAMVGKADILVQNLKPGGLDKLGFSRERLRCDYPRLILCSISGYGEEGPYAQRKAYDLLIQAESGLASITGSRDQPGRVGVSVVDIATGQAAYSAILEALLHRHLSSDGADIRISMFDTMADWMTVPLLQHLGGASPSRMGLAHPSIAPYGAFKCIDGAELLIAVQNDAEWRRFASEVLGDEELGSDPKFATNVARCENRAATDSWVRRVFGVMTDEVLLKRLDQAGIAYARVNTLDELATHPQLNSVAVATPHGAVRYPAPPVNRAPYGAVPALGEHTAALRNEFEHHREGR